MNTGGFELALLLIDVPMKTVHSSLLSSLFVLLLSSCTKESLNENIVGKWQIQEVYNGYANGGDFQWQPVADQYRSLLEFHDNGSFSGSIPAGTQPISATYTLINGNQIQINSGGTVLYLLSVNLSKKELTIIHSVREGEVKEKFIRL